MKENEVKSTISEETHHQQQVTADDEQMLQSFFADCSLDIADDGFSERVMSSLPEEVTYHRLARIWKIACIMIGISIVLYCQVLTNLLDTLYLIRIDAMMFFSRAVCRLTEVLGASHHLLMIVLGIVGIVRVAELNDNIKMLVDDLYPKTVIANKIIDGVNEDARSVRNIILLDSAEERNTQKARLDSNRPKYTEWYASLEKTIHTDTGKQALKAVIDTRTDFVRSRDKALELAMNNQKAEATALMFGEAAATGRKIALAGCELTLVVALDGAAPGLVVSDPSLDAIAEPAGHNVGEIGEGEGGFPARPAAGILERLRQVPMIKRQPRLDATLQQPVDEAVVEG